MLKKIKRNEIDEINFFIAEMESKNKINILPRPVVRDGNGELIKDLTPRKFFLKLQEEILEVMEAQAYFVFKPTPATEENVAEEIADIITVCISYLNAIDYDEEKRSELFAKINEKNEKRGYFEEKILAKEEK